VATAGTNRETRNDHGQEHIDLVRQQEISMKRMLIAAALAFVAGGQALAADLPPATLPPRAPATYVPVAAPVYNWGGVYVGINGGWGFGSSNWTAGGGCVGACSTGSFSTDGGLIGGTIGANFQTGQLVFGIEADADWSDINGSSAATNAVCPSCQTRNDWLGTVRGRIGYAFDRVLFFGSGGGAFGDVKAAAPGFGSQDSTEFGWTAGAGLEYAFSDSLTAKIEYLFVDLENASCTTVCGGGFPVAVSFNSNIVRAGINYKFGGF
jgi:outer membrane immunogenic protein